MRSQHEKARCCATATATDIFDVDAIVDAIVDVIGGPVAGWMTPAAPLRSSTRIPRG